MQSCRLSSSVLEWTTMYRTLLIATLMCLCAAETHATESPYILSITHGYSSRQLTVTYYPLPLQGLAGCMKRAEAEVRELMTLAPQASHFSGGEITVRGDAVTWESANYSGARFRAVARCRPTEF